MNISAIAFTENGVALACKLCDALAAAGHHVSVAAPERYATDSNVGAYSTFEGWTREAWANSDALLFVSATGIAVRAIAPYVKDKFSDPAVVSVDERGSFVIPLLSGHVGGANDLAREVAHCCEAQVAVSTATDVNGLFAIDEWARRQNLAILDRTAAKDVSAALLAEQPVGFISDLPIDGTLPPGFTSCSAFAQMLLGPPDATGCGSRLDSAPLRISQDIPAVGAIVSFDCTKRPFNTTLRLVPRTAVVGIGCKRGTPAEAIAELVDACLQEAHLDPRAICGVASIDVKADEEGLAAFAAEREWPLQFFNSEELAAVPGEFASSEFVAKTVGVDNVCERAACAGAAAFAAKHYDALTGSAAAAGEGSATLLLGRHSKDGVTAAIAATTPTLRFGQ